MPRQMSVTCEHGREFLHFPLCSECPPDETGTVALLRWLANEHPAEAVAQLIADGVLVEVGRGCQSRMTGQWRLHTNPSTLHMSDVPAFVLSLPTEEEA